MTNDAPAAPAVEAAPGDLADQSVPPPFILACAAAVDELKGQLERERAAGGKADWCRMEAELEFLNARVNALVLMLQPLLARPTFTWEEFYGRAGEQVRAETQRRRERPRLIKPGHAA